MKILVISIGLAIGLINWAHKVTVDATQEGDFNRFQTYSWMQSSVEVWHNLLCSNPLVSQQVEITIQQAVAQRGLREASKRPNLLIGYHFFVEDKTRMHGPYYGRGPSWWGWNSWGPMFTQEKYEADTIVVDRVDARTKQLIWRGSLQKAIHNPAHIKNQLGRCLLFDSWAYATTFDEDAFTLPGVAVLQFAFSL